MLSFFGRSWLSDKAAARCFNVTVACAASFTGAAGLLAARAAFFAGGMTISLCSWVKLLALLRLEQTSDMATGTTSRHSADRHGRPVIVAK
jgi:hypothetical protein